MKNFPIKKVREDKYSKNVTITNYRVFGLFPLPLTGSKSVDWISYLSLGIVLSLFLMVGIDSLAGTDLITSSINYTAGGALDALYQKVYEADKEAYQH